MATLTIREARDTDRDAVWQIFEPIIREGETYALARDISREDHVQAEFLLEIGVHALRAKDSLPE